jgi:hypothetical protein
MMNKIIDNCIGHNLKEVKSPKSSDFMYTVSAIGKLILRSSPLKIHTEQLKFLERIQGDICGPIPPLCGSFRYFMVSIDTSTRWSHEYLLLTRNHAFAKFMVQVIRIKANFPKHRIQSIRLDNVTEFSSRAFNYYCMAQGIQMQHLAPYIHTQNGLAESLIKRIKLIAKSLLHKWNLTITCWGHSVLHVADLIQLRPTTYHSTSPLYLVRGNATNISHLQKFGCTVYALISPLKHIYIPPPPRKLGIYIVYHSSSIIKYLVSLTRDLFTV